LEPKLESSQCRNILRKFKNKNISDRAENLKVDIAPFESSCINAQQQHYIAQTRSEKNFSFLKINHFDPTKGIFVVEASRDSRVCDCGRITVQKGVIAPPAYDIEESTGTKLSKVTQDLRKMKKKMLPKTVYIDPHVLAMSDSWYLQKNDGTAGTLNNRSLKALKERRFDNSQKVCQVSTPKSFDSKNQYRMTTRRMNKSITGSPIMRSKWL